MKNFRFKAIEKVFDRKPIEVEFPSVKASDYYGSMTFNLDTMQEYLPKEAYKAVLEDIEEGVKIKRTVIDQIAAAMRSWALSKGATHYTHWFQPLTGVTAEKHDSFLSLRNDGKPIVEFCGNSLVQQEPDASSFPSGGIRNTFEARGYTAWDPTSPAFIIDGTLCIPTIFVSYTGECLDFKTPLIRSIEAIDVAAVKVAKLFNPEINKVRPTLGWEQEYFLVDSALYYARPDLMLIGKTVFGHSSAKDQQLSDHYFGAIHERAVNFMKELEIEAHKLGIPLKTRHNEVAPGQFECAPIFEEANVANDHNLLIMHIIPKIARKHNFVALLHEKPYAGINGSGKHNNWSLAANGTTNLLVPGKTENENLRFLAFITATLKGVSDYEELLRVSIASAGNDCRLGGHEAPPAIMSVFIGSQLTSALEEIEKAHDRGDFISQPEEDANLDIAMIPEILLDNTDRNRTSPFAFTGNKFEFRAVGSTMNPASPMFVLNTIVAEALDEFSDNVNKLMQDDVSKDDAIFETIRKFSVESRKIRFEGNNYSDEWVEEAKKRGLSNHSDTVDSMYIVKEDSTIEIFEKYKVFTKRELMARYDIMAESYTKSIQIESRIMGDLALNHIIPTAIEYQNTLIKNAKGLKEVLDNKTFSQLSKNQIQSIKDISEYISSIKTNVESMVEERKKANRLLSAEDKARAYAKQVKPYFDAIRYYVDKLELQVNDELWPLPKYRELLFMK
ncbi:MAG: glutamine synthetase III [Hyphomicrobiales bacterium]